MDCYYMYNCRSHNMELFHKWDSVTLAVQCKCVQSFNVPFMLHGTQICNHKPLFIQNTQENWSLFQIKINYQLHLYLNSLASPTTCPKSPNLIGRISAPTCWALTNSSLLDNQVCASHSLYTWLQVTPNVSL